MSINGIPFLLFLAAWTAVYYLTPRRFQYLALLGASVCFYLAYSVRAAFYLLFTVAATYCAGLVLGRLHQWERTRLAQAGADRPAIKRQGKRRRRLVLAAILLLNFATLALFKYWNAWLGSLSRLGQLLGLSLQFRPLELLLPLGISFYTFQTAGYLIDVYRGKAEPERSFLKYTLFAAWFPQMIQGPINRYAELQPQLIRGSAFSADSLKYGIQLMLWGMLKKVFIADPLAGAVAEVYGNFGQYSGAVSFLGAALYCLQLYCDFSGGVDVVRGAARLFGVEMAENFRRPYFARSLDEFWRRWHISLGEWMKDYLFYPLALSAPLNRLGRRLRKRLGARAGKLAVPCISTVAVFLAVGVWQGPGLSNVAYGLWNGGLMSLSMICAPWCLKIRDRLGLREENVWFRAFQILRTCLLVVIGRYFSRAGSLMQALRMLKRTLLHFGPLNPGVFTCFGLSGADWLGLGLACGVLLAVSLFQERGVPIRKTLEKQHWLVQFGAAFGSVLLLVVFVYLNSDYVAIEYVYENV